MVSKVEVFNELNRVRPRSTVQCFQNPNFLGGVLMDYLIIADDLDRLQVFVFVVFNLHHLRQEIREQAHEATPGAVLVSFNDLS